MSLGWSPPTLTFEGLRAFGPIVSIEIGHPRSMVAIYERTGQAIPPQVPCQALIDTGASYTCIDLGIATRLNLIQTGMVQGGTAAGINPHPIYAAALRFKGLGLQEEDPIQLLGVQIAGQGIQALIGRDLLSRMLLIYDGPKGRFTLAE